MAITNVKLTGRTRDKTSAGVREDWTYLVETDSGSTMLAAVEVASSGGTSVPALGALLSGETGVRVVSKRSSQREYGPSIGRYEVVVSFSDETDNEAPTAPESGDPWNARIEFGGEKYEVPVTVDLNGKAIAGVLGEPFKDFLSRTKSDGKFTVTYNAWAVNAAVIEGCRDKINSAEVSFTIQGVAKTYDAETLKLVDASYSIAAGAAFWEVSLSFVHRADGWAAKVENKGMKFLNDDDQTVVSDTEVFLDADGYKLTVGADVVLLPFDVEEAVDFSSLLADWAPAP